MCIRDRVSRSWHSAIRSRRVVPQLPPHVAPDGRQSDPDVAKGCHVLSNTKESTQKYPSHHNMTTFCTAWQSGAIGFASLALHHPESPSGTTTPAPRGAIRPPDCAKGRHFLSNTKESTQNYPRRHKMPTFCTVWQSGATSFASLALHRPESPSGTTAAAPCGATWCHTTARLCKRSAFPIKYEREHPKLP